MDLWTAIFTVFRRWYVSLPILLAAIVACVVLNGRIKPNYEATASVIFIPPSAKYVNGQEQPFSNPWVSAGTRSLASVVSKRLQSVRTVRDFEESELSSDYELAIDDDSGGIDFTVTGTSNDQALETASALIGQASQEAQAVQAAERAPADELIRVAVIEDVPAEATPVSGSKTRVLATVVLLGLVAAASAAFMLESFLARRRALKEGVPLNPGVAPYPGYPGGYVPVGQGPVAYAPPVAYPPAAYPAPAAHTAPAGSVPVVAAPGPADPAAPAPLSNGHRPARDQGGYDDPGVGFDEADEADDEAGPPPPARRSPATRPSRTINTGRAARRGEHDEIAAAEAEAEVPASGAAAPRPGIGGPRVDRAEPAGPGGRGRRGDTRPSRPDSRRVASERAGAAPARRGEATDLSDAEDEHDHGPTPGASDVEPEAVEPPVEEAAAAPRRSPSTGADGDHDLDEPATRRPASEASRSTEPDRPKAGALSARASTEATTLVGPPRDAARQPARRDAKADAGAKARPKPGARTDTPPHDAEDDDARDGKVSPRAESPSATATAGSGRPARASEDSRPTRPAASTSRGGNRAPRTDRPGTSNARERRPSASPSSSSPSSGRSTPDGDGPPRTGSSPAEAAEPTTTAAPTTPPTRAEEPTIAPGRQAGGERPTTGRSPGGASPGRGAQRRTARSLFSTPTEPSGDADDGD